VFNTVVRILDDEGNQLPPGEVGEIATSGPMVVPGYWNRPDATERTLPGGELRTGDVGFMDGDGWFYLVDRKKDMIVAAGYKVWPREVEDTLVRHPAVREAAVIGVPDPYRGETVWAYVSLRPGAAATPGGNSSSSAARSWPPTSTPGTSRSLPTCRRPPRASCCAASFASAPPALDRALYR